jgi:hypothetical protein
METVAGNWTFSHLGPSPVSEGAEEILRVGNENMAGARISIEDDGNAAMLVAGHSGSIMLEVLEETPIYIQLGAVEVEAQAPLTYDRSTRLLTLPINLDTGGESKTLPAYFKRKSIWR